jgi:hypothetical protein
VDPETDKWPKLYRRTFLTPQHYEDASDSEREQEIRRHWTEFLQNDLSQIDEMLKKESWIWEEDVTEKPA